MVRPRRRPWFAALLALLVALLTPAAAYAATSVDLRPAATGSCHWKGCTPHHPPPPCGCDTPSPSPSDEPSESPSPSDSPTPSDSPSPSPTDEPSPSPTDEPSPSPSDEPSPSPSDEPSESPSASPSPSSESPTPPPADDGGVPPDDGDTLPVTGRNVGVIALIGGLMLGAGVLAVSAARWRRDRRIA